MMPGGQIFDKTAHDLDLMCREKCPIPFNGLKVSVYQEMNKVYFEIFISLPRSLDLQCEYTQNITDFLQAEVSGNLDRILNDWLRDLAKHQKKYGRKKKETKWEILSHLAYEWAETHLPEGEGWRVRDCVMFFETHKPKAAGKPNPHDWMMYARWEQFAGEEYLGKKNYDRCIGHNFDEAIEWFKSQGVERK